jgi:putative endonuclease
MYLYIIQSQRDYSFYIGITNNLGERLKVHNKGMSRYTKSKRPWTLVYVEWCRSEKDAKERERKLKKHKTAWVKLRERIQRSILSEQN